MSHWTRALKPHQDEETGETILFYPCPKIPNDIILDILKKRTDAVKSKHKAGLGKCLEQMLEKYTVDVEIWDGRPRKELKLRMWITEARGIDCNVDGGFRHPDTGEWTLGGGGYVGDESIYSACHQDSERSEFWKEEWGQGHTATFDYPDHPDGIWGLYSYVYQ